MIKLTFECEDAGEALAVLFKVAGTPVVTTTSSATVPPKPGAFDDMKDDLDKVYTAPDGASVAGNGEDKGTRRAGRPKGSRNKGKGEALNPAQTKALYDTKANGEGAGAPVSPAADEASKASTVHAQPEKVVDTAAAGSAPAAPAAPSSAALPTAQVPSLDDTVNALDKVLSKRGLEEASKLMAAFGVGKLRDLMPEKRGDFIKACFEKLA